MPFWLQDQPSGTGLILIRPRAERGTAPGWIIMATSFELAHPVRVLELFAGSRSFGKECDRRGIPSFSADLEAFPGIDHVGDFLRMRHKDLPWRPTFIVAGVPCTTYSIAGISHHRDGTVPRSKAARIGDQLVKKTISWAGYYGCAYLVENPVGMLRKMPFMSGLPRRTVTYCTYGDHRMKPTDLWSNLFADLWNPNGLQLRPQCFNGNPKCHHDRQPRTYAKRKELGLTKSGTCGLRSAFERSQYPPQLVQAIMDHITTTITQVTPASPSWITASAAHTFIPASSPSPANTTGL